MDNRIDIKLPHSTDKLLVTAVFACGSLAESDEIYGLGHLVEHCVCLKLNQFFHTSEARGFVDRHVTAFTVSVDKKFATDPSSIADIADKVKEASLKTSLAEFENEKNRILVELDEQCGATFSQFSELVRSSIILSPKSLSRTRLSQRPNIERFTIDDLREGVERLFSSRRVTFVGSNARDTSLKQTMQAFATDAAVEFSQQKSFRMVQKGIVFAFRGLDFSSPICDRFAIGFLAREIDSAFETLAYAHGSYQTYYQCNIQKNHGLVWFGIRSYSTLDTRIEDGFLEIVKRVLGREGIAHRLEQFKKNKKRGIGEDWENNAKRQEWVVDDFIDYGKVFTPKQLDSELTKITPDRLKELHERVFVGEHVYIFRS